jgi:hypothetical protein
VVPDVSEERVTFMDLENEGDTFVRRVGDHLPSDTFEKTGILNYKIFDWGNRGATNKKKIK